MTARANQVEDESALSSRGYFQVGDWNSPYQTESKAQL